ncbi:hypothetical protein [Amycolatopsis sp. NPDC059021]|uniref:hypothetical protein n=1 Tax=Amycolatopsis sp. NPDC059021 TaxID=3346704 RepID=UPI003670FA2A
MNLNASATLTDTTTSSSRPLAGQTVTFAVGDDTIRHDTADSHGMASRSGLRRVP